MSLSNYLNPDEEVLFHIKIKNKGEASIKTDNLGFTQKRIFHFKKLKGHDRIYRDIPLTKITYLETGWHDRNNGLIAVGVVLIILGLIFILYTFGILLAIGIYALVKGLKQNGYLLINNELWEFSFENNSANAKIEKFIQNVYFARDYTPGDIHNF